jgi:hypothetical protein
VTFGVTFVYLRSNRSPPLAGGVVAEVDVKISAGFRRLVAACAATAITVSGVLVGWSPLPVPGVEPGIAAAAAPISGKAITGEPPASGVSTGKGSSLIEGKAPIAAIVPTETSKFVPPPVVPVTRVDPPTPETPERAVKGFDPATSVEVIEKRLATWRGATVAGSRFVAVQGGLAGRGVACTVNSSRVC